MVNKFLFLIFFVSNLAFASNVMLLKEFKGDENISGWVMSEKLDGVRGFWDGKKLKSRSGKYFNPPKFWTKNFPNFAIDGELYTKRGDFENIVSIVKDKTPSKEWDKITLYVFDVPFASGGLLKRLEVLKNYLKTHDVKNIKIIKQIPIKNKSEIYKFLDEVSAGGGEGIVVRDESAKYVFKRSSKILKLKKFHDSECKILKFYQNKNAIASFLCQDIKNKVNFKIGSGFNQNEVKNLKIGNIITYKFQNLTKNKKPRFAIFMRVKQEI